MRLALVIAVVASPAVAVAAEERALIDRAGALLAEASAAREPPRVPPVPVTVKWKARRVDSFDLGAPLLALTSGDLDGDGRAELIAVTERGVVVLAPKGKRAIAELARYRFGGGAADLEPRDPVASAVVVNGELRARASTTAHAVRLTLDGGALRDVPTKESPGDAFPLCADREAALVAGRNYFAIGEAKLLAVRCRDALVDPVGRAMRVDATLAVNGTLDVAVAVRCAKDEADCVAARTTTLTGVGVAYAIADVDRDGRAEVITSAASAPGDPDVVTVHSLPADGGKPGKPLFKKTFTGGIGGLTADDVDGDGDLEVFAAVRLSGSERVDLWLLD